MLCRKFELIPIKFGFLRIFKLLKNMSKGPVLWYRVFHQKWLGESSLALLHFCTCIKSGFQALILELVAHVLHMYN